MVPQEQEAKEYTTYITISKNRENENIRHELLFSVDKKRFIRPVNKQKNILIYHLLPGRYFKFSLFAFSFLNSAIIQIKEVNMNNNTDGGKETILLEYGMYYSELWDILSDPKAPEILKKFIKMIPKPGNVAYVDDSYVTERINVNDISRYLEEYLENKRQMEDL